MKHLRCGLVGCGVISGTHFGALEGIECADLVAVSDRQQDRLDRALEKYPEVQGYPSYEEMLTKEVLDVVIICTDHASHADLAIEAMEKGCHVICEKPLTAHREELDRLLTVRQTHPELKAGGIFQNRFNPSFQVLRDMVLGGKVGKVLSMSLLHRCHRGESYYSKDEWRGTLSREGGSAMINQSIHFVDYLLQLGGEVDTCSGFSQNLTKKGLIETEDVFCGGLTFKSGALATINLTNASSESWTYRLTIAGELGTLELVDGEILSSEGLEVEEERAGLQKMLDDSRPDGHGKSYYGGFHQRNLLDFFQSIREGGQPLVSMESQAVTTAVVHELYLSARKNEVRRFISPC